MFSTEGWHLFESIASCGLTVEDARQCICQNAITIINNKSYDCNIGCQKL